MTFQSPISRPLPGSLALALAATGLLTLTGCTTAGSRATPAAEAPATWQNASAATAATATPDLSAWWSRFDDPTLSHLIEAALTDSPDLDTALSRITVARAQRTIDRAGFFPSLSAGLNGSTSANHNYTTTHNTTGADTYSAGFNASWELDLFGQQRATLDAATADLHQTVYTYHAAQVSLAAEVANAYLNLRVAETRLDINERTLTSRAESARLTQLSADAGVGDNLTARQAATALEQSRAALPALRQSVTEYRNQLALLCGRAPGELDALLAATTGIPAAPAAIAVGIPADTLRQRPDVQAAAASVEAANARADAARRDRLPTLSLTGSLTANAGAAENLFSISPDNAIASLAAGLTAPIFQAGRITENIKIQDEATRQALNTYTSTVLSALSEAENALSAVQRNREQLDALQRAVNEARTTQSLAHQRYDAGQVDYLTVIEADRTMLSLEESLATANANATAAHIQLYRALGGGWTPLTAES